jgi:hypothetical protein
MSPQSIDYKLIAARGYDVSLADADLDVAMAVLMAKSLRVSVLVVDALKPTISS